MSVIATKLRGIWSLLAGLFITGRYLCSSRVTTRYPRQTIDPAILVTFRGPLELIGQSAAPETPRCISCMMCVTACPSKCITITKSSPPKLTAEEEQALAEAEARGEKVKRPAAPKYPARYEYDFSLCSLCSCCVDACPVDAIRFSNQIYLSGTDRNEFTYELVSTLAQKSLVTVDSHKEADA